MSRAGFKSCTILPKSHTSCIIKKNYTWGGVFLEEPGGTENNA